MVYEGHIVKAKAHGATNSSVSTFAIGRELAYMSMASTQILKDTYNKT